MIRFDDGASSYSLERGTLQDGMEPPEREIRQVLVRWLSSEPWRTQLRAYIARELRVEARTDDALIDRTCALLNVRGMRLVRAEHLGRWDPSTPAEAYQPTGEMSGPTIASMRGSSEDQDSEEDVSVSYTIQFRAVDKETGAAIEGVPYRLILQNGTKIEGKTNDQGHTLRISTTHPEDVDLFWLASVREHADDEDTELEGC